MTDKQSEALRLAEQMEDGRWQGMFDLLAAAELRRLHEVNAELVEALKAFTKCWVRPYPAAKEDMYHQQQVIDQAKAALAKATGENND